MTDVTVRISHIRKAAICMAGSRRWFAANGLSWSDFVTNGIAVETIEAIGDPMAMRVAAIARSEAING